MPSKTNKPRHTAKRVEAGIREVRDFHRLGKEILERCPVKGGYGAGRIDAAAKAKGINADTLRKARLFAAQYGQDDLKELFQLCHEARFAPAKSLILRLVTFRTRRKRRAIQRKTVAKRWTMVQLNQYIATRYGARRSGGRRRAVPPDDAGVLAQIEGMCAEWQRWYDAFNRRPKTKSSKARGSGLPQEVQDQIEVVRPLLAMLQQTVSDQLAAKIPDRTPRPTRKED